MTILVSGSAGHLGEALARLLQDEGKSFRGIDLKPSDFTNMTGSIVDRSFCVDAMKNVTAVLHTASLHKPHVETHTKQDFIDTNITGTLNLLQAAVDEGVSAFIFTSTTSSFGDALKPKPGDPAAWIDESVVPIPKNIYGITKTAAEDLCLLFHKLHQLPCVVLKVSRFFPEEDDSEEVRKFCSSDNAKVNELLFRRADIYDMATAHLRAMERAPELGFEKFVISGTIPFLPSDRMLLREDASRVVRSYFPHFERIFDQRGWKMFDSIDRLYRNEKAREQLEWEPLYTFEYALDQLERGESVGSELSRLVGTKGYHETNFVLPCEGPYPVSM